MRVHGRQALAMTTPRIERAFQLTVNRAPIPDELERDPTIPGSPAIALLQGCQTRAHTMTPGRISARCSLPVMPSSMLIELQAR